METVPGFFKILKIELSFDPAIPLLAIYPKEWKAGSWGDICADIFRAEIFATAKMWKQGKCPSTGEWMEKEIMIKIYNEVLFSLKKKGNSEIMAGNKRTKTVWFFLCEVARAVKCKETE